MNHNSVFVVKGLTIIYTLYLKRQSLILLHRNTRELVALLLNETGMEKTV